MDQEMPMTEDTEEIDPVQELTPEQRLAMIAELAEMPEPETAEDMPEDEMKIGAMISRVNAQKIQSAHDALTQLGAACGKKNVAVDMEDTLVNYGGPAIKLMPLGDGRWSIKMPLVVFTNPNEPDLTGQDYFDANTDYDVEFPSKSTTYFHHGMDKHFGLKRLEPVTLTKDDFAVWAEGILSEVDAYEKFLIQLGQKGKLGMSSGVPAHLVERVPVGKAMYVKRWPLGKDASYTHTPAEPKTRRVVPIKSLSSASGVADAVQIKSVQEVKDMSTEIDVQGMIDAALAKRDAEVKAAEVKAAEMKAAEDAGYRKAVEELKGKIRSTKYIAKPGDDNDGTGAFKAWCITGQENSSLISPTADMLAIKGAGDAFNVTTGASGGFLVPDPLYARIIGKRNAASWIRKAPCQYFETVSDHLLVPREVTSMSDFVETAESAAYDENEGTVGQIDMALKKYTKVTQATEEFLAGDNSNWETWFMERLGAAAANTENTIATAALLAGATAATAAASQTALTIPEMERLAGTLGEGYAITGQTGYIMKRSTHFYLRGIQLSVEQPWDFAGEPVHEAAGMGAMTNGLYSTAYGNFNYFGVLERPGMLIQRNPWLHMATGEIDFFATIYRAVAVLQGEAFYKMAQA